MRLLLALLQARVRALVPRLEAGLGPGSASLGRRALQQASEGPGAARASRPQIPSRLQRAQGQAQARAWGTKQQARLQETLLPLPSPH